MEKIKVLVTDPLEEKGIDILKKANFEVDEIGKASPDKLCEIIENYDVVIVRSGTKITSEVIKKGKKLKIIGRAGVGLDNIDIKEATSCGIIVMNAPEGNTVSAAEHTIGMLFALARNIPQANLSVKNNQWERKKFMGMEVYGKTLGIIGLGRIGKRVGTTAQSLGMKILGYDPYIQEEDIRNIGISLVSLEGLCKKSDFISLHIPLTTETHHLLGKKEFELMKEGVRIINCARGGVVDEETLCTYIKNGKVKGASFDVFEKEPPTKNPLLKFEEVIATPHLGASTKEAQINVSKNLAEQIVDAFTNMIIKNAINLPSLDEATMKKLRGYLSLGEKIGVLLSNLLEGSLKEICIAYSGDIIHYDLSLLRSYILKGILQKFEKVNLVNAPLILKEKKIVLKEKRCARADEFLNLITVEAKGRKKVSASGILTQSGEARIVKIDDFPVEALPKGYLLICYNEDKPGIMGHIGVILGKKGINIASMTLGRKKKEGPAITVLNLDEGVNEESLKEIKEFSAIHSVKLVQL